MTVMSQQVAEWIQISIKGAKYLENLMRTIVNLNQAKRRKMEIKISNL